MVATLDLDLGGILAQFAARSVGKNGVAIIVLQSLISSRCKGSTPSGSLSDQSSPGVPMAYI